MMNFTAITIALITVYVIFCIYTAGLQFSRFEHKTKNADLIALSSALIWPITLLFIGVNNLIKKIKNIC